MLKFVVIDEELVVNNEKIQDDTAKAINDLIKSGIEIAIITHRSYYQIKNIFMPKIKNLIFICDDGGMIIKNGVLYYMGVIERRTLSEFSKIAERLKGAELYLTKKDSALKIVGENAATLNTLKEEISKITMYLENSGAAFLDITPNLHKNNLRISYYNESVVELVTINSTRALAVSTIMRRYGFFKEETAAFLSESISASIMRYCKTVIAEEKAPPEIKNGANSVFNSISEELIKLSQHYVKQSEQE